MPKRSFKQWFLTENRVDGLSTKEYLSLLDENTTYEDLLLLEKTDDFTEYTKDVSGELKQVAMKQNDTIKNNTNEQNTTLHQNTQG